MTLSGLMVALIRMDVHFCNILGKQRSLIGSISGNY